MKKDIFKLIVAEFEKLGIDPTQWLGMRTNVKRINKKNLADSSINEYAFNRELETKGQERLLKLFSEEAKYLGQLNDSQAATLLQNLKTVNKVMNPDPKPEAGIYQFSKLPGKELTPDEYTGKKAADEAKIQAAILDAGMKVSAVDQTLAKRLGLDMSKVSDWEKLQVWKDKHGVPDWAKQIETREGVGSLFKVTQDNPLADIGTQIDLIEKEGKALVDEAKKLTDMAWEMSPEGIAYREMIRKDINRRGSEGKGFAGGVFGHRNDGFFRAVVRPFLLAQHDKGKIKLAENTYNSLKNMDDLKGGGDFMSADPVRVFRQHYGDDAFDLIPDEEVFGMGPTGYGPTTNERVSVLEKVIKEPIMKVGPDNPGGYLTKGEYQAKMDHQDEVLGYIERGEGMYRNMKPQEIADEIAQANQTKASLKMAMDIDYPPTKSGPEVSGIDDKLKEDFEVISGDSKKGKEISDALGITAKPGFPVTEAGKADLKVVKPPKKKDAFGIRLIKNFDQDLTDEGLAQEGYSVQEIDILKRARNVMKEENQNPTDALRWVRGEMADDAGVDIDDFMTDVQWDDTFDPSDKFAHGGRVGYRYGTGEEGVQSLPVDQMQEIEGQMAGAADDDLVQKRANELALEIFGVEDYFKLTDRLQDALWRRAERELNEKAHGGGVGSMFRRV